MEASIPFEAGDQFFQTIDSTSDDVLRLHRVSQRQFTRISTDREKRGRKVRFLYLDEIQLLIITIPSRLHEVLHSMIFIHIGSQLITMQLEFDLLAELGGQHSRRDGSKLSGSGEGDQSFVPVSSRPGHEAWPTLVFEAGYSPDLQELRARAQWWFRASDFEVKIVVLVKYFRGEGSMMIEKWKAIHPMPRPGARTRALAAALGAGADILEPRCVQTIKIEPPGPDEWEDEQAWAYASGDLRLEFRDLFLREPGEGEGDIVIEECLLRRISVALMRRSC